MTDKFWGYRREDPRSQMYFFPFDNVSASEAFFEVSNSLKYRFLSLGKIALKKWWDKSAYTLFRDGISPRAVNPTSKKKCTEVIHIIKSLNESTHGYCAQVELQFWPKLTSSTHKSFKIPVKKSECYPRFPPAFLSFPVCTCNCLLSHQFRVIVIGRK